MKTDELITILSHSPQPSKPPMNVLKMTLAYVLVVAGLTLALLGLRSDLSSGVHLYSASIKTLFFLQMTQIVATMLFANSHPDHKPRAMPLPLKIVFYFFLPAALVIEWLMRSPEEILRYFMGANFPLCLVMISLYSVVGAGSLTWLMRFYAPANEKRAATMIGLTAGLGATLAYTLHCDIDSPTYALIAYGLPVAAITLATRQFVPRFIRW